MKKILIKTDGNSRIASGHIRRCLSIAEILKEKGASVSFWFSDEESPGILDRFTGSSDSFPYMMEKPAEKYEFLLLDSYSISESEFSGYRKYAAKTGYIDDLRCFDPDVDLLINYDPDPPEDLYHAPVKLLGTAYAPLRKQFAGPSIEIKEKAKRILVSTGGTDPYHILTGLLNNADPSLQYMAVIGAVFDAGYRSELQRLAEVRKNITLCENVSDMAGLMRSCDIAVTAGGTTLYELCACGIPSIVFTMADNQLEFTESFYKRNAIWYEGDARKDPALLTHILSRINLIISDQDSRRIKSDTAHAMVNGTGSFSIADAILSII